MTNEQLERTVKDRTIALLAICLMLCLTAIYHESEMRKLRAIVIPPVEDNTKMHLKIDWYSSDVYCGRDASKTTVNTNKMTCGSCERIFNLDIN